MIKLYLHVTSEPPFSIVICMWCAIDHLKQVASKLNMCMIPGTTYAHCHTMYTYIHACVLQFTHCWLLHVHMCYNWYTYMTMMTQNANILCLAEQLDHSSLDSCRYGYTHTHTHTHMCTHTSWRRRLWVPTRLSRKPSSSLPQYSSPLLPSETHWYGIKEIHFTFLLHVLHMLDPSWGHICTHCARACTYWTHCAHVLDLHV